MSTELCRNCREIGSDCRLKSYGDSFTDFTEVELLMYFPNSVECPVLQEKRQGDITEHEAPLQTVSVLDTSLAPTLADLPVMLPLPTTEGKPLSKGKPLSVDTSLGRPDKKKMHAPVRHAAIPVTPQSIFEQYQDRLPQYSLMAKGVLFTDQETKTRHTLQEMFERYGIPEDSYRVYFTLIDIRETLPQDLEFIDSSGNEFFYFCNTLIEDSQEAERAYNFITLLVDQWYQQRPDTE